MMTQLHLMLRELQHFHIVPFQREAVVSLHGGNGKEEEWEIQVSQLPGGN